MGSVLRLWGLCGGAVVPPPRCRLAVCLFCVYPIVNMVRVVTHVGLENYFIELIIIFCRNYSSSIRDIKYIFRAENNLSN